MKGYMFALLALLAITGIAHAKGITYTGTVSITLGSSALSASAGNSTSASYTVALASGYAASTNLNVVNSAALAASGIGVSFSPPSGVPKFSGTLTITVSKTTVAGTYFVSINATGQDSSTTNANLNLTVLGAKPSSPAPVSTTAMPTSTTAQTTATTTVPVIQVLASTVSANPAWIIIIAAVVIAVVALLNKRKPKRSRRRRK